MDLFKRTCEAIGKHNLLYLLLFTFLGFLCWSVTWAWLGWNHLLKLGFNPLPIDYILEHLDHRYITGTIALYLITGVIPFVVMLYHPRVEKRKIVIVLWVMQIIAIVVSAIVSKAQFYASYLSG